MTKMTGMLAAVFMVFGIAGTAQAKEYKVLMLNAGPDGAMVFSPSYLKISPGDEVLFVAQDKAHNAQSIPNLTPPAGAAFKGALSQNVRVKFTAPGLYGYECMPHFAMGMVGLVQVGPATNKRQFEATADKLPPLARARMTRYLAQVR